MLAAQIDNIDRACKLTEAQKEKLHLAGRGDIKRFFDRYERVKGKAEVTQRDGRRFSAADAFLRPALARPNLTLAAKATVLAIEFEHDRAVGVRVRRGRRGEEVVRAAREVLLCAGAINSPQLLLLSGVGAADELCAAGVPARHELPGVGRNLQDHPFVTLIWEVADRHTLYGAEKPKALAEWLLRRSGPLSSTVAEVVAFVRTRGGLPAADIQFHMGAAYYEDHGAESYDGHCMVIAPALVAPRARGQVWLRSADPHAAPEIRLNYLSTAEDKAVAARSMRFTRRIMAAAPLAKHSPDEWRPGPAAQTDEALVKAAGDLGTTIFHPVGTCRMGRDALAVVDDRLRVHGIEGLRVIDASVMPRITSGNTNAPTYMIAERGAEFLLTEER